MQPPQIQRQTSNARLRQFVAFCILHSAFCIHSSRAASTSVIPIADTTLSENWPSNNLGGLTFVNSGTTQNFTKNRGLYKFDVAAAIPAHSRINSARLVVEVTKQPADDQHSSDFGLHRMLQPWGEGNKISPTNSVNQGQGSPATDGEATWYYRFAFTNSWAAPGAAPTNDYVAAASAAQTVYGLIDSPYTWGSTAQMIADVQFWLDNPSANFGWALVCQAEATDFTARRFASREDTNYPPSLNIDFIPPPQILSVWLQSNQFTLVFAGEGGQSYFAEYRDSLLTNSNWNLLTNIGSLSTTTNVVVTDSLPLSNPNRFYRVGLQ